VIQEEIGSKNKRASIAMPRLTSNHWKHMPGIGGRPNHAENRYAKA